MFLNFYPHVFFKLKIEMNNEKRKRIDLTLDQKREILNFYEQNPRLKQIEIKIHFEKKYSLIIGKSTLSELIKSKDKYFHNENIRQVGFKR